MGGAEGPNLAAVDAFKALSLLRLIYSCGYWRLLSSAGAA